MPEAAIEGILWKKVFFKVSQNLQKHLGQRKHLRILRYF